MAESGTDEPVTISALQHWMYCPRQCALIHQEQAFAENVHTLRGQAVHRTVDTPGLELRAGCRIERALPIWSDELGLIGKADVVEFQGDGQPYPVEYKHGSRHKTTDIAACDDVQLAAQAMCLEGMTGKSVPEGAIFYAKSKKRRAVSISRELRETVRTAAVAVRQMIRSGHMPAPLANERCKECSLFDICEPFTHASLRELDRYQGAKAALFDPNAE